LANLDTRNKRFSILSIGNPFMGMEAATPDGTIAQADRQQLAFMYSGIAAGSTLPSTGPGHKGRGHHSLFVFTAPPQVYTITLPVINDKV